MEYHEQLEKWFEELDDWSNESINYFENIKNPPYESEQICAVMFLYGKLKDKNNHYFFQGDHDTLYIGGSFDIFEEFTKEDVKTAMKYGIRIADDGDGFEIYASM
jgi:hypothetical protein